MTKPKLWVTYAWEDNEDKDIDFILAELEKTGKLEVKFDRRNLIPGQRLWPQIGGIITDPEQCDAWGIVVSGNSLLSQPCVEELSYALDRALSTRGKAFPMMGLLHKVNFESLPPSIKIRLCINLAEEDWAQRVLSGARGEAPGFDLGDVSRVIVKSHPSEKLLFEVRPRHETWAPFRAAVPLSERAKFLSCWARPPGSPQGFVMMTMLIDGVEITLSTGEKLFARGADNPASPTNSYYLSFSEFPSKLYVGDGQKAYDITSEALKLLI